MTAMGSFVVAGEAFGWGGVLSVVAMPAEKGRPADDCSGGNKQASDKSEWLPVTTSDGCRENE